MSYTEDLQKLVRLEKLRILSLIVAFALLGVSVAFDVDWLIWPRALAWSVGGVVAGMEARCEKRLGRDPDGSYLRAGLFMVVAIVMVITAVRS